MSFQKVCDYILEDIRTFCKVNHIRLILDKKHRYLDGDKSSESSAYFCHSPKPIIKISLKDRSKEEWIVNLLHEKAHAEQWIEDCKVWRNCFPNGQDVSLLAEEWIEGKILDVPFKNYIFETLFELEKDAEVRKIRMMIKYGLHRWISIERTTQEAWAYINGYLITQRTRMWIPANRQPYDNEEIVNAQPKTFAVNPQQGSMWLLPYLLNYPDMFMGLINK